VRSSGDRQSVHRAGAHLPAGHPDRRVRGNGDPPELRELEQRYYSELIETIAATDDTLLEHYLEGETITREEAVHALKQAMIRGELVPLFCGAPNLTYGVRALLTELVELMPSPQERPAELTQGRGDSVVQIRNLNSDPFCALVFKTTSEPHVGELSYFRVFGGSVGNGQEVYNAKRDRTEKLAHLSVPRARSVERSTRCAQATSASWPS
jgi:elongation factor G